MQTKKSNRERVIAAVFYFRGRHVTEQEVLAQCGLTHRTFLATRAQLIADGWITCRREAHGYRYLLTEKGQEELPPDAPVEPKVLSDGGMPHVRGHFPDFSTWAEELMEVVGDDVQFNGQPHRRDIVTVFSESYFHTDYYRITEREDHTLDVW